MTAASGGSFQGLSQYHLSLLLGCLQKFLWVIPRAGDDADLQPKALLRPTICPEMQLSPCLNACDSALSNVSEVSEDKSGKIIDAILRMHGPPHAYRWEHLSPFKVLKALEESSAPMHFGATLPELWVSSYQPLN